MTTEDRNTALTQWVKQQLGVEQIHIQQLAGDASFRRYARIEVEGRHLIVMDAPTTHEDSRPFVGVDLTLAAHGVRVPKILAYDLDRGFMLLEDFGDTLFSDALTADNADEMYAQAMNQLIELQQTPMTADWVLPSYHQDKLISEMGLFDQWFLPYILKRDLTHDESVRLTQPQVFVHRDYHCRNLMVLRDETALGIIDFQDAVIGPITYDLVSLLRDAYVAWPQAQVQQWVQKFWQRSQLKGQLVSVSLAQFEQWFDLMGAQRHLKVLGIFVRLSQRDGKHGYLGHLPLVLSYLILETRHHAVLAAFAGWLRATVLPAAIEHMSEDRAMLESLL
jgi:aminoglycoside/choline kinase family phosphotransferase